MLLKFIYPQNYNTNSKLLGLMDYSTAIFNIIWLLFVFVLSNIFFNSLSFKISVCIIFYLPILIFSIVGFNNENIVYVILYIIKFYSKPRLYIYSKN